MCISAEERTHLRPQWWLEAGQGLGSGRSACGGAAAVVSLLQAPEPTPHVSCHSFSMVLAGSHRLTLVFPLSSRELHAAFQGEEQTLRCVRLLAERNQPDIWQPAPHRAYNLLLCAVAEQRFPGEGPLFQLHRPGSFLLLLGEEEPRRRCEGEEWLNPPVLPVCLLRLALRDSSLRQTLREASPRWVSRYPLQYANSALEFH